MGMIWKVQCNDGTMDEGNPTKAPCVNNGGIKLLNIDLTKPLLGKPNLSQQTSQQQAVLQAKSFEKLTAEDRLYEKLGIKYHNTHMFGVASRLKGRLLLAVILIGTYFAYKKIK